ncbi:hypothetical protein [Metabacillus arenae]|uniref:Uncharacterized protein n=1 Tax=Metabacillus arenae TaxID=2771434 RepID=A0A926RXG6_9BACI|nr:hypothetical protein [Metabacillus arenae]MBD1381858.1 hypothetical protein [Metabacillus arenae]
MNEILDQLDLNSKGLWFPIIVSILLFISVLLIPKKNTTWREIYITVGIVGFATWLSDSLVTRVFDLIDLGEPKITGLGEILCYTLIPTSLAALYLNYFTNKNKWILTILFTVLSLLVEFGMHFSGYMKYNGWNLYYSILFLLLTFGFLLPLHIRFIRGN